MHKRCKRRRAGKNHTHTGTFFPERSTTLQDDVIWDKDTVDLLEGILEFCADVLPCELSHALKKPCYEVNYILFGL